MGITAGFCNLKAQFIPSDIAFKSVRFDSVKVRWDFMAEDSEANSRKWNNGLIKLSWAAKVWTYLFVLNVSMKLQRIIAHILWEVYAFKSFAKLIRLGYVFLKWRVLRASKRDLEQEISTPVDRDCIFFSCKVFEVQSKPLLSSHLSIVMCCAYTKLRWSQNPLQQVNHFTVKLKTLNKNKTDSQAKT